MRVIAAVALAAVVLGASPAIAGTPFAATTSVSTKFLYFADTITARVVVVVDRRQADAASVRVTAGLEGWDRMAPPRTESTSTGPLTRRSWSFEIACLEATCLPQGKPLAVRLPPVTVTVTTRSGSVDTVRRSWPALSIAPRFGAAAPGSTPAFDLDQSLAPASYRADPTTLGYALDGFAAFAAAVVLALAGSTAARRLRAASEPAPPLARALALVRQAATRTVDDRRRAAGLLARALEAHPDSALLSFASRVAWSKSEPVPERLDELVRMVETSESRR